MFVVSVRERGKEEHKFTFRKSEIVIGRLRANDIILPKRNISKRHASMKLSEDGSIVLYDNGSTNGSYINGKKIMEPTQVSTDDKIFMGDYILQVEITDDVSAIDATELAADIPMDSVMPAGGDGKPTVAEMESEALKAELDRLGIEGEEDLSGPSTVVVDPMEVPTAPPPDLDLQMMETEAAPLAHQVPTLDEEEEQQDTMRFRQAADAAPAEEPQEEEEEEDELLDIPLLEELEEAVAEPEPTPEPEPAPEPEPEPDLMLEPTPQPEPLLDPVPASAPASATPSSAVPFAPSVSRLEAGMTAAMSAQYANVAGEFDGWLAALKAKPQQAQALKKLKEFLIDALGDNVSGGELDTVANKVLAELSYLGAVADLLEDPRIGEVYVASSGLIAAYDWRGALTETGAALSCPAATARIAAKIQKSGGPSRDRGLVWTRLSGGTVARAFVPPYASGEPCLRFVRPYQTSMTLGKLQETGVATREQVAKMKEALDGNRSFLILGPASSPNSLVLHSLAESVPSNQYALVAGDRFAPGVNMANRSQFTREALASPEFAASCAAMDFDWVVLENGGVGGTAAVVRLAGSLQIPFVVSARSRTPRDISLFLAGVEQQPELLALLDAGRTVVVTTSRAADGTGKVDGLFMFSLEAGKPKLMPLVN